MSAKLGGEAAVEWRRNWPVVLAAMGGVAMSTIHSYSTGLFFEPFEQEFGWTRAQIAAGPAIAAFATVLLGPFLGAAIDQFGPRRIGLTGVFGLCGFTLLASLVGPSIWSWWAVWVLLASINLFILPTVWTAAVSQLFSAGRGLALAVTLSGSGIASLVTPVLGYQLIERFGWRMGFVGLALFWGILVIPAVWAFFFSPADRERTTRAPGAPAPIRQTIPLRERLDNLLAPRFLQLAFAGFLFAAVVVSLIVSLVPVLSWNELERQEAASVAALAGFSAVGGRLLIGFLLDRVQGRYLAAFSVLLPVVAVLILLTSPGSVVAATFAVLIVGFALGAELDIVAYLTSRYFTLKHFGLLFGTIAGLITLAGGSGPFFLNLIYDATQSYRPALLAYIPMCLLSSLLFLFLGPYPATDDKPADAPAGH